MARILSCVKMLAVALAATFALSMAVAAAEFSADIVMNGNKPMGKVWIKGDMTRQESKGSIVIVRPDKKVAWILNSSNKTYSQMPGQPRNG